MSRTYYDGQAKGLELWFCHKVIAVGTSLQCQAVHERVLKAIDAKQ